MEMFDFLNCVTQSKEEIDFENPEIRKKYSPYMISRFISMCHMYLPYVDYINQHNVPPDVHYRFFCSILPKRKQFFKYMRKVKNKSQEDIDLIQDYFDCSPKEAEIYFEMFTDKDIKELRDKFKEGKVR